MCVERIQTQSPLHWLFNQKPLSSMISCSELWLKVSVLWLQEWACLSLRAQHCTRVSAVASATSTAVGCTNTHATNAAWMVSFSVHTALTRPNKRATSKFMSSPSTSPPSDNNPLPATFQSKSFFFSYLLVTPSLSLKLILTKKLKNLFNNKIVQLNIS